MGRMMKDSGIPWIGIMPAKWELHRMKSCVEDRTSGAWGNEAADDDGDTICLRIADFDYSKFRFKDTPIDELTIRNYDGETIRKLLLKKGDILIEKSGGGEKTPVGRTVIFDKDYPALYANFMDRIRCSDLVTSDWMQYVFVTFYKNGYSKNYIKQTTGIQNLDLTSMLACERIPVPSTEEQNKIVDFLDSECDQIDAVIEETRASIEEYKKLKQAVITEAVTKGIKKNRPLKDSGLLWVEDIPADWNISRIKALFNFGKGLPITKDNLLAEGIAVISYGQIHSKTNTGVKLQEDLFRFVSEQYLISNPSSLVKQSDFIFADTSEDLEGCGNCVYVDSDMELFAGYHTIIFQSLDRADKKYLAYLFKTDAWRSQIRSKVSGVKLFSISRKILNDATVLLPSEEEHQEIVAFLDEKCAGIDALIAKKEQLISEMDIYKRALIFEYVTGKKEVPA
ncbi:MAG: restriction endonuclease subunit S [Clostridia bacterium]|nr:restriction endonuclease subunit S [Clostridia bacterium]